MSHQPWWIALQCSPPDGPQGWLGPWALQFSPRVAWLEEAWLVELGSTLRLWGGPAGVVQAMQRQLQWLAPDDLLVASGHTALLALANWRHAPMSLLAPQTSAALSPQACPPSGGSGGLGGPGGQALPGWQHLPLPTLGAARPHAEVLARLGVRTWGQLARLPRDGVARRWGNGLLAALDRARGHLPDEHIWLTLPPAFDQTLPCTHHLTQAEALLAPVRQLLAALQGWLVQRQSGVLALRWRWTHDRRRHTTDVPAEGGFDVHTAQPVQHLPHLLRLTTERLTRQRLVAPVVALRLQTLALAPWAATTPDWLTLHAGGVGLTGLAGDGPAAQAPLSEHELIERLQARLGEPAVIRWQVCSTHLPEAAQAPDRSLGGAAASAVVTKVSADAWLPTWIFPRPVPLAMRGHRPCYQGELELLAGPHRLELAAWAAPQAATVREHFVARSPGAGLLWVFRQPGAAQAWFLQGWYA